MDSFLQNIHPMLARWFTGRFGEPTDVQRRAWDSIQAGHHTLIAAPTGSGKTLAALLPCLDRVVKAKLAGTPQRSGVRILYITPLKALNNDIHHHVLAYIDELDQLAKTMERVSENPDSGNEAAHAKRMRWPAVTAGLRTGDTPPHVRNRMLKHPPDLLVTTPESLYLLLTSSKAREMLETAEVLIVDEIHDLAGDRRGAHLSLSLERLTERCLNPPQRIGVSATQNPVSRIARFLGGWEEPADGARPPDAGHPLGFNPRPVTIIESAVPKNLELRVAVPGPVDPNKGREAAWIPLMDRILKEMEGCRSTLVFTNSRRLCERLVLRLNEYAGGEIARSHHGSMSREKRLEVEQMLKEGKLRCLIATSTLELGIDVGHIDRVIQIDSPLDAASGIQRIGRAGHAVGGTSSGVIIARRQGELPEIAVLSRQIRMRAIEPIRLPQNAMDVLSQHIVSMVAMDDWPVEKLHRLIVRSDSYRSFPQERLLAMLEVLAGLYPFVRPLLDWDRNAGVLRKRGASAMAAVSGAGTIPSGSNYPVHHADSRAYLGELDEEFVHESRVGDVFQLGTTSWIIRQISRDRVYVSEAANRFSEIPFWRAEPGSRSFALGEQIGQFLHELCGRLRPGNRQNQAEQEAIEWLTQEYGLDRDAADQLISLVQAQQTSCGVPTHRKIVIEYYRDMTDQIHVILHNVWGRRLNQTWLMALEQHFARLFPYRIYSTAKNDGIEFVLPEWDRSWLNAIWQVTSADLEPLLLQALPGSSILPAAFRQIAETSLLLSRGYSRMPLWQKRLRGETLLREAMPFADRFPYWREALDRCLQEHLDLAQLRHILDGIADGTIEVEVYPLDMPSPFARQFLADYVNTKIYESDELGSDLQLQLLQLNKTLAGELFGSGAVRNAIEPDVLDSEKMRLERGPRGLENEEDVWNLLKRRGDLNEHELRKAAGDHGDRVQSWTNRLLESRRAAQIRLGGENRWICADEREWYAQFPDTAESRSFILNRYIDHVLSFRAEDLAARYGLSLDLVESVIRLWRQEGRIEPAPFAAPEETGIWTSRKVAERLIRLSLHERRKQTEPADPLRWCSHQLARQFQHGGETEDRLERLREMISRMQGLFLPFSHWEAVIFPSRIAGYRKEDLDLLCASGEVLWIGKQEPGEKEGKIAFFLAEAKELAAPCIGNPETSELEPADRELYEHLCKKGASFLTALSRELDRKPSELLERLIELVWRGLVSNDQFAPLRLHAGSRNRSTAKTSSGLGRWYALSSLVGHNETKTDEAAVRWAHHLLELHGIVTKDLVRQHSPFEWEKMGDIYRQLEEWGLVARGIFIRGVNSLQFTTKEWAAALRRPGGGDNRGTWTLLSAADPVNPYGLFVPWPDIPGAAFSRKPGNYLILDGERWLYWIERYGRKIVAIEASPASADLPHPRTKASKSPGADGPLDEQWLQVFQMLMKRHRLSKIVIESWNGEAAPNTGFGRTLLRLGAEKDRHALVFWPSTLSGLFTKSTR
jgi:ATP-dependent Lhr-like helicase